NAVEGQDIDNTDGIKIWYPDGWILIRPSGTEPLIRIFAESKSEDRARKLLDFGSNLVNDCNIN
ncbi:MAG TPA: phosphoglucosamine mutase, partial [Candidatus Nanoarchaeia archaeon]|nr:phosphoglucosamine mutase [Candidatus Nanoarchaeia archaeon]